MFIEKAADFDTIVNEIRGNAAACGPAQWVHPQPSIAVPRGPIEHW
jgi:hypothetical protein